MNVQNEDLSHYLKNFVLAAGSSCLWNNTDSVFYFTGRHLALVSKHRPWREERAGIQTALQHWGLITALRKEWVLWLRGRPVGHSAALIHRATSWTSLESCPMWTLLSKLLGEPPAWPTGTPPTREESIVSVVLLRNNTLPFNEDTKF